jgi:hypothetical protein
VSTQSAPAFVSQAADLGAGQFDFGLASKQIQQDGDAIGSGHHPRDNRPQSMKRSAGQLHGFTLVKRFVDNMNLIGANPGAKVFNDVIGNCRAMRAKPDDAMNARGEINFVNPSGKFEPGEQVVGKQSLGKPDLAARQGTLEADAGQIHFDSDLEIEPGGGNVFALGMSADTKPGRLS